MINPAPTKTPVVQPSRLVDAVWALWFSKLVIEMNARVTPILADQLPPIPTEGMVRPVTDSTTAVWGATITGGGALHVLGYFDGTNWTVMAS
jgi:hypothetical protein